MLGGLLTLCLVALADVLLSRSIAGLRALLFVVLTGTSCLMMTGLPELLAPDIPAQGVLILKASLGPLCGAIALTYLGLWLGVLAEDRIIDRLLVGGAYAMVLSTVILAAAASQAPLLAFIPLLTVTAAATAIPIVLAVLASLRSMYLGDPLAKWMVLACVLLAGMVAGLYARGLQLEGLGWDAWALTALCTVAYFVLVMGLAMQRNRMNQQLESAAGLTNKGEDAATGLPTGSVFLSKIDDAFWRSARRQGECTVVCLNMRNLYELGEQAGHGVEQQILSAMAARIRRAVGFRCIVGLYHPRCFVVVISAIKQQYMVLKALQRLQQMIVHPLNVTGRDQARHTFVPKVGFGVVTVLASKAVPSAVLDAAERKALGTDATAAPTVEDTEAVTTI